MTTKRQRRSLIIGVVLVLVGLCIIGFTAVRMLGGVANIGKNPSGQLSAEPINNVDDINKLEAELDSTAIDGTTVSDLDAAADF